ncbi:MAG: FAD-dependent oxidoreductase [Proteobacteria bacterium]|nr:FAD-dependent oxidoreductase [Pseudomonadota bacterium]
MKRRSLLLSAAALAASGCAPRDLDAIEGGFNGIAHERGHRLRVPWPDRAPDVVRRTHTVIAGGGVAGLAAARALRLAGHEDFALLELEDSAGGNSRGGAVMGIDCPLGAHYLPVPGDDAQAVQDLLEELGLRRRVAGRWQLDERHLCHSPQERLFFRGQWQDGLLPLQDVGAATLAQYRRFAAAVRAAQSAAHYAIPVWKSAFVGVQFTQDAMTFEAWLGAEGLNDPQLLWYLDYCCRDDFGAGLGAVSAWAGLHYFASRHGFHAPGEGAADDESGLFTWPQGNGWLSAQLAAPLGDRLHPQRVVGRIDVGRHGVTVDVLDVTTDRLERWQAQQAVVALPVRVAARVLPAPPAALRARAAALRTAPWLVANLRLAAPLQDRPGAAPAWDNVLYGSVGLGYVDAMHQSLQPVPGPTVLTWYRALGDEPRGRAELLERPWTHWRDQLLAELAVPHPDLPAKLLRMELTRYGHAMAVPVPSTLRQLADLRSAVPPAPRRAPVPALRFADAPRLAFAHSDWSGYSVFEEAFTLGHAAGVALAGREP